MATKETDQIEPQATSDVSVRVSDQDLHDKTVRCIRCGFCLEACPTYRLTGRETESPRGRIYLVRSAIEGQLRWDENVQRHLDTCLGCRACEPACPSGVEYGSILEMARERLEKELIRGGAERFARGRLLRTLTDSRKIRRSVALSRLWPGRKMPGWISRLLSGARAEVETPVPETGGWPPADYPESARRVFFLEGCAMRALFSRTNAATVDLLRRHRCDVIAPPQAGCCGALHTHNGSAESGRDLARRTIDAFSEDIPVITNSAGCGSAMKAYGHLLERDNEYRERAAAFSLRVRDISEFLAETGFEPPKKAIRARKIAYQDACHLAHGQGIKDAPRELLASLPGVQLVELKESDMCCGSAGVYNLTQPVLARRLLERKWRCIEESGAEIIASGNPGCLAWIQQAARERRSPIRVVHTAVLLAEAYLG